MPAGEKHDYFQLAYNNRLKIKSIKHFFIARKSIYNNGTIKVYIVVVFF